MPNNNHFALTAETLHLDNQRFRHTGGVSQNNRKAGFQSAFLDQATGNVYISRDTNGNPASVHLISGLPNELVTQRDLWGRPTAIKNTVIAGFVHAQNFYTREQVAQVLESMVFCGPKKNQQ
jgi:hypothetical protein